MSTPAYLTITGSAQGNITEGVSTENSVGNVYQEEHENEILVQSFRHSVEVPVNAEGGQPTGQRVHKPLTITKMIDKCSPMLYHALSAGERLNKCELKFYRTSISGTQEHFFTIELVDAIISEIKEFMPDARSASQGHITLLEEVSFTYRQISWSHIISGTMTTDDWCAEDI